MATAGTILIGAGTAPVSLNLCMANRHGLIAGATGTGKTVSMQVLAEGFSAAGVPVFMADIKGDFSGICQPIEPKPSLLERAQKAGVSDFAPRSNPALFWDVYGEAGHPVRATISDMGPLLLSRMLDLNATQEGVLNIAFKVADDQGMLLLDFKDLRAILQYVSENAKALKADYGNASPASIGTIQRNLLVLEQQGGEKLFGEPALELKDLMRTSTDSRGYISVLAANKLMENPRVYATFLLWLLSELFEELPEVGDLEKPKLVFFFDEAHLLFNDAPKHLLEKVEQVVRLIRSKGVGIYFVTQNPLDVPDTVLGQLGNRIQHALRAFTPRDRKAVKAAAETFRENAGLDTFKTITELGVGEALVSVLDAQGSPTVVDRVLVRPPQSRIGPATDPEKRAVISSSPVSDYYTKAVDRDSAYEMLRAKAAKAAEAANAPPIPKSPQPKEGSPADEIPRTKKAAAAAPRQRQSVAEAMTKSAARSVASSLGRQLVRGILGSLFKGR